MTATWIGVWTWIWSTRHCGLGEGSGLLISFYAGKTQLVSFDWSNNTGVIEVKMKLFLRKNSLLSCRGWLYLLNWSGALVLSVLLKLPPRKLELWFIISSFFPLKLLCISINLPYGAEWNTVVKTGLLLLDAARNFWISYKTDM